MLLHNTNHKFKDNNMKNLVVFISLLLCIKSASSAQEITGRVVDQNNHSLAFANVTLLKASDSTFISGTVTNSEGQFKFTSPIEKILIHISFLGYQTLILKAAPSLGIIALKQDAKTLGTVTVKTSRSPYKMGKEGLITNVFGTSLSQAGTIADVLKYVPGLTLTNDGINVFGKGTPIVYINERQVRNMTELNRINSQQLKDVEVIQNPGPEYSSDVRAVIKVRLLKPKGQGFGVGLTSMYAQSENCDFSDQLDLSYNNKNICIFGQYKWDSNEVLQKSHLKQIVYADSLWKQNNALENRVKDKTHSLTAGFDYTLSKKHSLGLKYTASFNGNHHSDMLTSTEMTANSNPYDQLYTHTWTDYDNQPEHEINAYYTGLLGKTSVNFNIDYLFKHDKNTQHNDETSTYNNSRYITSMSSVRNNMVAAKLILDHKLFGGMLSGGAEAILNNRHDDYMLNRTDILANSFSQLNESQVSPFIEYQHGLSFGKLNAGVRFEHITFKYYENSIYMPSQSRNFNNIFPSLSLSTKLGNTILNVGYSVKTKRPTYRQLSNNIIYINRFSMQSGNPNLNSEHIHDITAMAVWKYIQAMVSWQNDNNAIIYWAEQMPENTSVTTVKYKNLNSIKSLTAMFAIAPTIGFWSPRFTIGARKQYLDLETMMGTIEMNKPMLSAQWANILNFPWDLIANIDMSYQSKGHYQNSYSTRNLFGLDFGITKSFLKRNIVLKIEGKDLLHLQKTGTLIYSNQMHLQQENIFDSRMFKVTLTYNFNASKAKYRGIGVDKSEKRRL